MGVLGLNKIYNFMKQEQGIDKKKQRCKIILLLFSGGFDNMINEEIDISATIIQKERYSQKAK
jgi:hypothetical protein